MENSVNPSMLYLEMMAKLGSVLIWVRTYLTTHRATGGSRRHEGHKSVSLLRSLPIPLALLLRFPLEQVLLGDREDGAEGVAHTFCVCVAGYLGSGW